MDDVLTWQAGDVRTRPADVFALDDCDSFAFPGKSPRSDGRTRAAPENHQIKFFGLRLLNYPRGRGVFGAVHGSFPFWVPYAKEPLNSASAFNSAS
jgi:hypothetical protein